MGNLGPSIANVNATDPRPFQSNGSLSGTKNLAPVQIGLEWLVDTGACVSAITHNNGNYFDLIATGASANATTGGAGIIMKRGLTTSFWVKDPSGIDRRKSCQLDVGVKPNNQGSEILGMDQIAHVQAKVSWDPSTRDGDIQD
jgi:hypothetical protein